MKLVIPRYHDTTCHPLFSQNNREKQCHDFPDKRLIIKNPAKLRILTFPVEQKYCDFHHKDSFPVEQFVSCYLEICECNEGRRGQSFV
jgi:hypothetical protein